MSYQVLARKWRPRRFADMVGQSHVLKALANALDQDRLHHAYLFSGTRGVGKTTLARILAKCLNCDEGVSSAPCGKCGACTTIDEGRFVDLIEVDAASRAKVDETRELMENVPYAPTSGRYKVYLIDEIHMFSGHSFNALLKTLEEPPPHVKFLLATTEPKKLPVTILSRCLQFNLSHLTADQIHGQIDRILAEERVEHDEGSVALIAKGAAGSMRDALSLLDQAIAYGGGQLREPQVRAMMGTIDSADLLGLLRALAEHDAVTLLNIIQAVALQNPNFDDLLAEFMGMLQQIAIIQALPDAGNPARQGTELIPFAGMLRAEDIQLYYQIALKGRRDLYLAPDVKSGFEMTFIRMLAFRPLSAGEIPAVTGSASTGAEQGPSGASSAPESAPVPDTDLAAATASENIATGHDWKTIVDEMNLKGLVKQLASHCALKSHTSDKVELSLPPSQQHLLNNEQKARLEQAIRLRFGGDVRLVMTIEDPSMETPTGTRSAPESAPAPETGSAATTATENIATGHDWKTIVDEMNLKGLVKQLASHCALKSHTSDKVELSLPPSQQHLLNNEQKARLEQAIRLRFGGDVRLVMTIEAPSMETPTGTRSAPESAPDTGSAATTATENIATGHDWKTIVDEMNLKGLVKQLASHCALKSHTSDKVELSLPPSQQHLLNNEQKARLEQAIRLRFGGDVRLVMTIEDPSMETPTETKARQSRERQQAAEQSVRDDETVQALIDIFDARIDEDSVQPVSPHPD